MFSSVFSTEGLIQAGGIAISIITFNPSAWYISAMYTSAYSGAVTAISGGDIGDILSSAAMSFAIQGAQGLVHMNGRL